MKAKFTNKLKDDPHSFATRTIKQVVRTDGMKLVFDNASWVCYRLSGTEPVVRVYSEARSAKDLKKLASQPKSWIFD